MTVLAVENASSCETKIIIVGDGGFPTVGFSIDECTFYINVQMFVPNPFLSQSKESLGKRKHVFLISV